MKIGEKKMGKKEMKLIHAGGEENAGSHGHGLPGKNPESKCAFAAGSCCKRTQCPTESDK